MKRPGRRKKRPGPKEPSRNKGLTDVIDDVIDPGKGAIPPRGSKEESYGSTTPRGLGADTIVPVRMDV